MQQQQNKPLLVVDVRQIDMGLKPVIASVLSDMRAGRLPALDDREKEDECTSIVTSMLKSIIQYAFEHSMLEDLNKANIEFNSKPEVECLRIKKLRVKKRLGSGAFGQVFLIDAKRVVKVFSVRDRPGGIESQRTAFLGEVEMGKKAHVIGVGPKILDSFVCSERHKDHHGIIIMDRIPGTSLEIWTKRATVAKALAMRGKVEALIEKMHRGGLFHNDLHVNNIMVTKGGEGAPMFVDFAYARQDAKQERWRWPVVRVKGKARHRDFEVLDAIRAGGVEGRWREDQNKHSVSTLVRHVIHRAMTKGLLVVTV